MVPAAVRLRHLLHLARRFLGALDRRGPHPDEASWVAGVLLPGERSLWDRMSGPDQRHAVGVARGVQRRLPFCEGLSVLCTDKPSQNEVGVPSAARPVLAAALLHDVGKIESGLGTWARVPATIFGLVARERAASGAGRIARYLRHDTIGADLLAAAGADPLTVAWAREHHLPPERWTLPRHLAEALKAADDD